MVDDLPTYVLKQIASELKPDDRQIAAYLLTHLDEDGLLTANLMEVANYYHVPISKVEAVQNIIRHADPYGVGSSNSTDALLVQLELLEENNAVPSHTKEIIESGLDLLSKHQYSEIAKKIGIPVKMVQEAVAFISDNLNPFPARSHWGDARQSTSEAIGVYRHPDIIINTIEEEGEVRLVIEILLPISGTLQVNHVYKQAIKESEGDAKVEMKGDLERASLFVKCIQQRNNTLVRLLGKIANIQKDFILSGEKQLKPVTRASIAKELGVHESTISRAVANKSMQLPNKRIVPLSMFFDRSLNVRTILKDIIENEMHPLSDFELKDLLEKQGFAVARRTVAKYRAMEGILPAHLRQEAS
jgi:RNA polymerase sigma-54 factor